MTTLFETKPAPVFGRPGIQFTVFGHPAPQGSSRAFIPKGWSRAIITTTNTKLKPWRQQVTATAQALNVLPLDGSTPVRIRLEFFFEPPRKMPKDRRGMTTKPDVDKLIRAILDALKGVLFHDDAQVNDVSAKKFYGSPERVEITLE